MDHIECVSIQEGEPSDLPAVSATCIGSGSGRCFWRKETENFSTLDMFSGYHEVKMAEDSNKFKEFTTSDSEHLAFNRLCFGHVTLQHILFVQSKGYFKIL